VEERTLKCLGDLNDTAFFPPDWKTGKRADCPVRQVFDRVGDRWSMYVMAHLEEGTLRFNEIRRRIDGLSQRVLTVTLRSLERDGLVTRTQYPTIPPQVDYRLTPLGRSLISEVRHVVGWSGDHYAELQANRASFDGRAGLSATLNAGSHSADGE